MIIKEHYNPKLDMSLAQVIQPLIFFCYILPFASSGILRNILNSAQWWKWQTQFHILHCALEMHPQKELGQQFEWSSNQHGMVHIKLDEKYDKHLNSHLPLIKESLQGVNCFVSIKTEQFFFNYKLISFFILISNTLHKMIA